MIDASIELCIRFINRRECCQIEETNDKKKMGQTHQIKLFHY